MSPIDPERINVILATDCGSTTTKAILIEKKSDGYRLIVRGEAPTTVEAPFEDVTMGVLNAIEEVEELSGKKFIDDDGQIIRPAKDDKVGCDIYISTSSAGGGLQMMVAGLVREMTAESAERAALGAGSIVMDVIANNDNRLPHEQIERIRKLRPDMILLSGGTDGGNIRDVVEIAEIIKAADPKARLGSNYDLPVIYAGNKDAREAVSNTLKEKVALDIVDNIRPVLEEENLGPARDKIHDLFMEHVMQQAPGYPKLMSWTDAPIMPTPGAVGLIMRTIADLENIEIVGVDIGGATTDIFSVFQGKFNRTVSANLGMSYSVSNVFAETGVANVMRWVPLELDELDIRNRVKNKMVRPTTIPQSLEELVFEQALAREALRLAFEQHKSFATVLKGVQKRRTLADAFKDNDIDTLVNLKSLKMIIGSGGVLSHAPRRSQAAYMMIDAFLPEHFTRLAVDSIFMMPQLGVLTNIHKQAATEVFHKDCLIHLGTCVAPTEGGKDRNEGNKVMDYTITLPNEEVVSGTLNFGELKLIHLADGEKAQGVFEPTRRFSLSDKAGKAVEKELVGGVVGVILDGRGRPLELSDNDAKRRTKHLEWIKELEAYPEF